MLAHLIFEVPHSVEYKRAWACKLSRSCGRVFESFCGGCDSLAASACACAAAVVFVLYAAVPVHVSWCLFLCLQTSSVLPVGGSHLCWHSAEFRKSFYTFNTLIFRNSPEEETDRVILFKFSLCKPPGLYLTGVMVTVMVINGYVHVWNGTKIADRQQKMSRSCSGKPPDLHLSPTISCLISTCLHPSHLYSAGEQWAIQQGHFGLHCPEAQWVSGWRASNPTARRQVTCWVLSQ